MEATVQHNHLLSLCPLERASLFASARSFPHSAFGRTSEASPWEWMPSWPPRSALVSTAHSQGGRRSAAYRGWSDRDAWTLDFWRNVRSSPSECGHSPCLAPPRTQLLTRQKGCRCDPRPETAWRGRVASQSPRGPAGGPGWQETLSRIFGESEPGRPGSSATRSWRGLRRERAGRDAGGWERRGPSLAARRLRVASL